MYGDNYSVGSTLPTLDGRFEFEWDGRMLTRARRLSDYTVIDYRYDADGNRTEKKVTNADGSVQKLTKYYYTDGVMTTEVNYLPNSGTLTADTKIDYIYDNTGLAFVMVEVYNSDNNYYVSTGKYTFYVKRNAQGDVTSLIDITSGNTGDSIDYIYTAYGRHYIEGISGDVSMMIADLNTVTYKGYSYDSDLEMYYLGSRWYDPEVCRFISGDSYVKTPTDSLLSTNMFAYCENNPVNKFDPTGNFALTATLGGIALWKIGAAIIGVVATFAVVDTLVKNPPTFPTSSISKIEVESKAEAKDKTKDIAPSNSRRDPVHHIVAKADPRAAESRKILRDVGIEPVTDSRNLVVLPQRYHSSLHNTAYYNYVTEKLRPVAGDKAGVEATLASLKTEILVRSAAGIRWD